jgi:hypothetical protein
MIAALNRPKTSCPPPVLAFNQTAGADCWRVLEIAINQSVCHPIAFCLSFRSEAEESAFACTTMVHAITETQ